MHANIREKRERAKQSKLRGLEEERMRGVVCDCELTKERRGGGSLNMKGKKKP